ncbi:hypothetical protein G7092_22145 [Mucilaginibacter sp. HC2]|uniref:hypothetical protein n=1 Tax=Mucilaginibacter inviolabilis TaxID=2714892 RepID=UPI001407F632|nr:hypothetical protein [Mucilaginibacter inviolabilis]NHA06526.1 hypothetical protein [Mucilaginibacter inviolabilis]
MKKTLIVIIFILLRYIGFAQHPDRAIDDRIKHQVAILRKEGVDTICIYQEYCVGCEVTWNNKSDRCDYDGYYISARLYWKKNGLSYMTAKDNCFDYSTAKIMADSLWGFYFRNMNEIRKDTIRSFQYIKIENNTTKIYTSAIDHSFWQNITMIVNDDIVEKHLNDYNFEKAADIAGHHLNINYEYNRNTSSKKLELFLDSLTKSLSKRKVISRIN